MASVFLSYSHADREFVRRLAQDLTNQAVEVWLDEWRMAVGQDIKAVLDEGIAAYDFFLIVLSETSIGSGWVRHELEIALEKEVAGRSGVVLPILLERVTLPAPIADRQPFDFTNDYTAGLNALVGALGHVTVKIALDTPRLRIITARRGIKTVSNLTPFRKEEGYRFGSGTSHRLTSVGFVTETGAVQSVIESTGDPRVAIELTTEAAHVVREMLNAHRISRNRDDIIRIFLMVDALAKMVNAHRGLGGLRWVACKMSLFVWVDDAATVAAVGKTGAVIDAGSGITFENASYQAQFQQPAGPIDPSVVARFPLGYLVAGSFGVDQHDVDFVPGATVALTSFALPVHPDDTGPLAERLSEAGDPLDVPRVLAEWHWPPVGDAFVCLVHRDA
jgi:hypothetical protein